MVSLESVECIATSASPDNKHAVSIQPDPQKGEALVLFTTDKSLSLEALLAAAHKLGRPELAVPRKIVVLQEIPLLGSGKIDYLKLEQMAEGA
jgi:acyl-[acyl-carrier-protein]-phospholipid O-acyltransferase/long-chain-fatty-acid--[acyl-carrier-protein] ligase